MNLKRIRVFFLLLSQIIFVASCSAPSQKHEDPFYDDKGTYDSKRLPLINPYYLIYITDQYGWQMSLKGNFPTEYYYYNVVDLIDVRQVAVQNGVVMVYTPYSPSFIETGQVALHWFVVIPDDGNSEVGFNSESAFLNHIQTLGLTSPQWKDPDTAYKQFNETGCFDWIPDCDK
jgi:hypothetical protein